MNPSPAFPPVEYTQMEKERLIVFRERCEDLDLQLTEEQLSDPQLIRWLRARNFDVDKALHMLKLSLEWRKENNVDGILEREDIPEDVKAKAPFANLGVDANGHPILIVPVGRQDTRGFLEKYGTDTCLRFQIISLEKIMKHLRDVSKQQGRPVTQIVQILDFEGYSFSQFTNKIFRDYIIQMQKFLNSNYPDLLHCAMIINAPKIFYILFNVIKPLVPKATLEKVEIFGAEPEKWKKAIAARLPLELVPPHWGGTRQGSDEYCSQEDIWKYGPVPISFFTGDGLSSSDEDLQLTKATVNSRDIFKIPLNVIKCNSSICWRFRSDIYDIGFQIVFEDNGEVILPFNRVQSQNQLQEGTISCSRLGTYNFIFDNTYSLSRSKTVFYNVSVMKPETLDSNGVEINNKN